MQSVTLPAVTLKNTLYTPIFYISYKAGIINQISIHTGPLRYTIRRAILSDVPEILRIQEQSTKERFGRTFFEKLISNTLVATSTNKVIGSVTICYTDPTDILIPYAFINAKGLPRIATIATITISQQYRNYGIGTALLLFIKQHIEKNICLQYRVNNPAGRLYKRMGFKILTIIPKYYPDGTDAYLAVWPN